MADELNKKKPDLGAGVSSPAPSPAPKANPNPAPKVNTPKPAAAPKQNSSPAPAAPKANNFSAPKQTAPKQPKVDPVRQKIINQGFAPKDWKKSAIDDIDKFGGTNVGVKNGQAIDAYKHNNKFYARTYADKENGAPSEDDMSDIYFKDTNGNDIDGFDTFEELVEALHKDGYPVDDQLREQPQQPAWNKENDPGSGVVTKELTDWVRDYLTKQVGENYANTIAANLHKDHNQADFYKGKMKEAYEHEQASEREQASELYKMDLNKN